ncbi:MAG TPA: hypothetical protein VMH87_08635 [Pseudomonadales bacterium]|nr:hypothetical protein [Pseudomonadales bacterium]
MTKYIGKGRYRNQIANRARYLNTGTGRFWTMDTYQGNNEDSLSLHKYLYGADDPVNLMDPSGNDYGSFDIILASILRPLMGFFESAGGAPVASESGLGSFAAYTPRISSKAFWSAYAPVDYDDDHIPEGQKDKVWLLVGGSLDVNYGPPKDNDTCATRMSYALNRSGLLIPYIPHVTELNRKTVVDQHGKAGDGYRYIVGAIPAAVTDAIVQQLNASESSKAIESLLRKHGTKVQTIEIADPLEFNESLAGRKWSQIAALGGMGIRVPGVFQFDLEGSESPAELH